MGVLLPIWAVTSKKWAVIKVNLCSTLWWITKLMSGVAVSTEYYLLTSECMVIIKFNRIANRSELGV